MSEKPVVFVSSVIRTLRDLRSALSTELTRLGYEVVIAEGAAMTVEPNTSIHDICLTNVERCDIFILIIDRARGSLVDGEWLVRSEYLHAVRKGKAVYVLVKRDAWIALELAVSNPRKNSEKYYGVPESVISFLAELNAAESRWIIHFDSAEDLLDRVKTQLVAYFARLLRTRSEALWIRTAHLLEHMHSLYRQGTYVQAVLTCEEILRIDRHNAEALLTRAVCRIRLHGLDHRDSIAQGIADCETVLHNDGRNYRAMYNLANFKLLSPEHAPAEVRADLEKLFAEFPEYKFYFESDAEFRRMLEIREMWSTSSSKRVSDASSLRKPGKGRKGRGTKSS